MDKKHILLPPPYSYITFPNHSPLSVFCNLFPPVYYTGIVVGCIEHDMVLRFMRTRNLNFLPFPPPMRATNSLT